VKQLVAAGAPVGGDPVRPVSVHPVVRETDVLLPDGRVLHAYHAAGPADAAAVCWHHGTSNLGAPPEPLLTPAEQVGLRWFSFDRPGYGGSTLMPGRTVGSIAADAAAVADALEIGRLVVIGHSGGGPHALACAALLGDRVTAAVALAGPAPYDAAGLDWFAGMAPAGVASNRAAARGRAAREAWEDEAGDTDFGFTEADEAALDGRWSWVLDVVRPAIAQGPAGAIDDDLAAVSPWGFDPCDMELPVLLVHGGADRVVPVGHGRWLAGRIPGAELWERPTDGHITVLDAAADALAWLVAR
jgi:pimeloyl-ACP methyl ester carboxylesterase